MRDTRTLAVAILATLAVATACSPSAELADDPTSPEEPVWAGLDACKTTEPGCEIVCVNDGFGECDPEPDPCPKDGVTECPPHDPCDAHPELCNPGCALTQGFWKNHPHEWPIEKLTIGGFTYWKNDLLYLLWLESDGTRA